MPKSGQHPRCGQGVPLARPSIAATQNSHTRRWSTRNRNQSHWVATARVAVFLARADEDACRNSKQLHAIIAETDRLRIPELCEKRRHEWPKIRSSIHGKTDERPSTRRESPRKWPMRVDRSATVTRSPPLAVPRAERRRGKPKWPFRCKQRVRRSHGEIRRRKDSKPWRTEHAETGSSDRFCSATRWNSNGMTARANR